MDEKTVELIEALRGAVIRIAIVIAVLAVGGFFVAGKVLLFLKRLAEVQLVAYGVPDAFFAYLTIALALAFSAAVPYSLYALLGVLPRAFPKFSRKLFMIFWAASVVLFGLGVLFCLKITLPYGIKFLLSYQTERIVALISVRKFVSFCFWFIFGFGLIFELPLLMILLARIGSVSHAKMAAQRRYAVVAITTAAAVLTPTPDIFNMILMAAPLYLLFEIGLLGMRIWPKK